MEAFPLSPCRSLAVETLPPPSAAAVPTAAAATVDGPPAPVAAAAAAWIVRAAATFVVAASPDRAAASSVDAADAFAVANAAALPAFVLGHLSREAELQRWLPSSTSVHSSGLLGAFIGASTLGCSSVG